VEPKVATPTSFPKLARLRAAADFAALREAAGRFDGRYFLIRYTPGATLQPRVGLAVSKRVSKRAVERNRIKRVARESFRRAQHKIPPTDIVVIARTQAAGIASDTLREDLDRAWPRLKTLKRGHAPGTIAD